MTDTIAVEQTGLIRDLIVLIFGTGISVDFSDQTSVRVKPEMAYAIRKLMAADPEVQSLMVNDPDIDTKGYREALADQYTDGFVDMIINKINSLGKRPIGERMIIEKVLKELIDEVKK